MIITGRHLRMSQASGNNWINILIYLVFLLITFTQNCYPGNVSTNTFFELLRDEQSWITNHHFIFYRQSLLYDYLMLIIIISSTHCSVSKRKRKKKSYIDTEVFATKDYYCSLFFSLKCLFTFNWPIWKWLWSCNVIY